MKWLKKVAKIGYIDTRLELTQVIKKTSIDEAKIKLVRVSKKQSTFSEILRW